MSATVKEVPLITRDAFVNALESCVTGVHVVATEGPGGKQGAVLNGMTFVSADPRLLMICLHRDHPLCSSIEENRSFSINVLAEGQKTTAQAFSSPPPDGTLTTGNWTVSSQGTPLLHGAIASFDCELHQQLEVNEQVLLVGEVNAVYRHHGVPLARHARQYVLIQRDQY